MKFPKKSGMGIRLDDLIRGTKKQDLENTAASQNYSDESENTLKNNYEESQNNDRIKLLVDKLQKSEENLIKPYIDFNEGNLFYPILSEIGELENNVELLDSLVERDLLEKKLYEKLTVCPMHSDSLGSTIHLYCPSCNSNDVEKLNLFEHKKCGYIADSNKFQFSESDNFCPSCKKEIKNFEKEIKVPAMWYQCYSCHEKFDNVVFRLYCRKYDHDYDTNAAKFFPTFSYSLKPEESDDSTDSSNLVDIISPLLIGHNFTISKNHSIAGKSGNMHTIPFFAKNTETDESILIFIKNKSDIIDESDLNPILVTILDIGQKNIVFLTNTTVKDRVFNSAKAYGVKIITKPDADSLTSDLQNYLSSKFGVAS